MKKISTLLLVGSFMIWIACNPSQKNESESQQVGHTSEAEHHEEHDHESSDALMLDNGKKWMVDEPTRLHVGNMEKAVGDPNAETGGIEFYRTLAGFLKENIGKLTAECSMTGPSHDELHKWLYPFIETTKEFSKAKNPEEALQSLNELKKSFSEFHEYFE